ncbi:Gfo/Idh/MocA family oxidoreductase [Halogeometricum sp. S1BR25-6]|uniref:Gfo/Idh/MocA family oxidoreductase n=1 Tax=Halogeometricum salsisoli TaxID=2950536 RepID=A0ABU2GFS3_9EURY|nr:Gfo/Idh/MocA family oxidoreductase [Halogeometricum sp. S1BR25-6]MDS0299647.1 Gfo/Idh/MocA family oxidoreductase [Halogeometricum sp. S1BR25-6]
MTYDVAIVGTGPDPEDPDTDGFAMGYRHASAYDRLDDCRLAACVDIIRPNAEAFAETWGLAESAVYEDVEQMLQEVRPDVVSVTVPPSVHADVVLACAESDSVQAIHCEKPMAKTWDDAKRMVAACEEAGVRLTFNHQRRFGRPFREAKRLLDDGAVGSLERVEIGGPNLYDFGTHLFDLCGYYTDQSPPEWVLCGVDYGEENVQFGAHNENNAIAQWGHENGVVGIASTGDYSVVPAQMRLVGDDGLIDICTEDGPPLRYRNGSTNGWKSVDTGRDGAHGPTDSLPQVAARKVAARLPFVSEDRFRTPTYIERAIEEVVTALVEDRPSELSGENALQSTELIFGAWESARRRERVAFPLEVDGNALEEMVESNELLASDDA